MKKIYKFTVYDNEVEISVRGSSQFFKMKCLNCLSPTGRAESPVGPAVLMRLIVLRVSANDLDPSLRYCIYSWCRECSSFSGREIGEDVRRKFLKLYARRLT